MRTGDERNSFITVLQLRTEAGFVGMVVHLVPHGGKIAFLHKPAEIFDKFFMSHQGDQSLRIVGDKPGLLENIAFNASRTVIKSVPFRICTYISACIHGMEYLSCRIAAVDSVCSIRWWIYTRFIDYSIAYFYVNFNI